MAGRKFEAIDLMKLYVKASNKDWNRMLTDCLVKRDVNRLAMYRYQIQAGMDDLAKGKLNDDRLDLFYIRLLKSLEKTAKKIIAIKHPMPGDNALIAKSYGPEWLSAKRKRDRELQAFLKKSSY